MPLLRTSTGRWTVGLSILLPALVFLTACSGFGSGGGGGGRFDGKEMEKPVAKPSFTLTNVANGKPYDFADETDGYVTLLYFGYTYCPKVCPVQLANLGAVLRRLPWEMTSKIRVVFVTVDPVRDTPERLNKWLSRFGDGFVGLRGTQKQVHAIEKELGLPPSVVQPDSAGRKYFVAHAAQVLAFGLDDTARIEYPYGTRQKDWWHDLQIMTRGGSSGPGGRPAASADGD